MPIDPRLPVLIGTGQVTQRAATIADAAEPVSLMGEAIRRATSDAGLSSVPDADLLAVVQLLSWKYLDPARIVAGDLGIAVGHTGYTTAGGNTPQYLLNLAAKRIAAGEMDIAILTGGEASRTRAKARKEGVELPWRKLPDGSEPDELLGSTAQLFHEAEVARKLYWPVQIYPMFESAWRASLGRMIYDHQVAISELWARFSDVAATNPYAWSQTARTAEEIRTVGPNNRMIGFPYPKYMNSNNDVDQSAAVIVCSVAKAEALGVPRDRWVFLHAGTDCHDTLAISHRAALHQAPAIGKGGRLAFELAGVGPDDIDVVDLYSCFPSAVQIGADALGFSLDRQLTQTGGLQFAGGPWNNYVMHAIATVANRVRDEPGHTGLVWGNGGYLTKHSFGIMSTEPPANGFRWASPQDEINALPQRELAGVADAAGHATVEAYTVMHDRDGQPEQAIASCLLADGRRAWGMSTDSGLGTALCEGEWVGRGVVLDHEGTLHTS